DISSRALRTLRAAAVIGEVFEAELVAALLDVDELDVLEHLQEAADSGAGISDAGDSRFRMIPQLRKALTATLLPSLAKAWHARLAQLLSGKPPGHQTQEYPGPASASERTADTSGPGAAPTEHLPETDDAWD